MPARGALWRVCRAVRAQRSDADARLLPRSSIGLERHGGSADAYRLLSCTGYHDPVGLAVPVFFANGHDGDVLQPWPSPAWPVKGITGSRSVVLRVTLSTVFRRKRASDSRTFERAHRPRSPRSHRRRCEPPAARKASAMLPSIRRASARRHAARTNGEPTRAWSWPRLRGDQQTLMRGVAHARQSASG